MLLSYKMWCKIMYQGRQGRWSLVWPYPLISYNELSQTRTFSFSHWYELFTHFTARSTSGCIRFMSKASKNSGKIVYFVVASATLNFLRIQMISSLVPLLYASLAALKYIIRRFSVVEFFQIITLKSVSQSAITCFLRNVLMICFRSFFITMSESHSSAKQNVSAPSTDLTTLLDLFLSQSITFALLYLSSIYIGNHTWDVTSLFVVNHPSEYTASFIVALLSGMYLKTYFICLFICFI